MNGIDSFDSGSTYRGALIFVHVKVILFTLFIYDACKSQSSSILLQLLTQKIVINADKEVGCNDNLSFSLTHFISLSIFGSVYPPL